MNTVEISTYDMSCFSKTKEKYSALYCLLSDETMNADLLKKFLEKDRKEQSTDYLLLPEESDFLLRDIVANYRISDDKLEILIENGIVSSGKRAVYPPVNETDYEDEDRPFDFMFKSRSIYAPNALFYAITKGYPLSTIRMLHEKAKVPYDVDCHGVPFIVHAFAVGCSDEIIRYLAEIASWDFERFEFVDDIGEDRAFPSFNKPDYYSVDFEGRKDGFGNDIVYYVEKYNKERVWESLVRNWADEYVSSSMEIYDDALKP